MLRRYQIQDGKLVESHDPASSVWLYIAPDETERRLLVNDFKLDEHTLNSCLDPDELSRLEFEPDHMAMIWKRPKYYSAEDNFMFRVASTGCFMFKDRLVVVVSEDAPLFDGRVFLKLQSLSDLMVKLIYRSIFHFLEHLKVINMISEQLEQKINSAMENKYLLSMFTLEKSLVYYLNAIHSNGVLVEKLKLNAAKISLGQEQVEFLDDVFIENNQCYRQAEIYSNILASLMNARVSIVSNNLNVLMKQLTVLSVVFMPLNVLAGIGGMSEFSMMTQGLDWRISYTAFTLGMVVLGYATYLILQFALDHGRKK
jgi:magnesium transporter